MKEIKLKVDGYTKIILTIIGICLIGLLLRPILMPEQVIARSQITEVDIVKVGGFYFPGNAVPVKVVK